MKGAGPIADALVVARDATDKQHAFFLLAQVLKQALRD